MADIEKRLNKAAVKKAPIWGTAVDTDAAGMGFLPLNPGSPKAAVQMIEDEAASAFEGNLDVGLINPSDFPLDFDYRWDGRENLLLAMLMGTAGVPAHQGATAAYLHSFVLLNTVFGIFGTYATEKGAKIHTVPSFKVLKGAFSLSGGLIKAAFNLRGIKVIDDSALPAAFTSTTVLGNTHARAKFSQAVFHMNAQTGDDFADGDIVRPKSFTLEIERKMDSEHVAGIQTIVEPVENDKPSIKLTMDFPRMDTANAAYFAAWIAGTEKKADLKITGPLIETPYSFYLKFQLPRLIIEDVEYADSKIIPAKIVLRGLVPDSAPIGMTGVQVPVVCQVMNTMTVNYLA
jgi:hypothetical protein